MNIRKELLKNLPKIDEMMLLIEKRERLAGFPREIVKEACRSVVEELRGRILADKGKNGELRLPTQEQAADRAAGIIEGFRSYRLRRVINATGVILHTNLGRAPLCREAIERVVEVARGYSNLEYDLEKGERGLRYDHVRELLCALDRGGGRPGRQQQRRRGPAGPECAFRGEGGDRLPGRTDRDRRGVPHPRRDGEERRPL